MKERVRFFAIFLIILLGWLSPSGIACAGIDWTPIKQIKIDAQPLDVAASQDGKLVFILAPGEILVYSVSENKITSRFPVSRDFDRITYSAKDDTLILTSRSSETLKIIRADRIHEIDISGLPFEGPEDAPVLIAVFDDYQ